MSDQFIPTNTNLSDPQGFQGSGSVTRPSVRERMRNVQPFSKELVELTDWDMTVEIHSLSLGERNEMLANSRTEDGEADITKFYPEMILRTTFDPETGEAVFAADDIAFINSLPADTMDKLAKTAMRLSGMTEKADDEAGKESSGKATSE